MKLTRSSHRQKLCYCFVNAIVTFMVIVSSLICSIWLALVATGSSSYFSGNKSNKRIFSFSSPFIFFVTLSISQQKNALAIKRLNVIYKVIGGQQQQQQQIWLVLVATGSSPQFSGKKGTKGFSLSHRTFFPYRSLYLVAK